MGGLAPRLQRRHRPSEASTRFDTCLWRAGYARGYLERVSGRVDPG